MHEATSLMSASTWSRQTVPGVPRFAPSSAAMLRASIFTWWDVLDRAMESFPPEVLPDPMYGYIREGAQLDAYIAAVQRPGVVQYCEIGTNGGHGTVAVLLANPQMSVVSFDLGALPYSSKVRTLLNESFPGRIRSFTGSSHGDMANRQTLAEHLSVGRNPLRWPPQELEHELSKPELSPCNTTRLGVAGCFAREVMLGREAPCDVALIDGDHSRDGVLADMAITESMVSCEHVVLMDDIGESLAQAGLAVEAVRRFGVLSVSHARHFNRSRDGPSPDNPCLRWFHKVRPYHGSWAHAERRRQVKCLDEWGFLIARFSKPPACVADRTNESRAGSKFKKLRQSNKTMESMGRDVIARR